MGRLLKRSQFSGDVSHVAFVAMDVDVAAVVTKVLPDVIGPKTSVLVLAQR